MSNSNYVKIISSETDKVARVMYSFNQAYDADLVNRRRSYENWKAYFGVDGGQWEEMDLMSLRAQNRHAAQYNIIGPKVDALTGSLVAEGFDLDWLPMEGPKTSLTEGVKTAFYADKELCGYEKNIEAVIHDAMIYKGVMKIKMNSEYNPLKNIAFERVEPGYVVFDPYWISDNDKDCQKAWEVFHYSAAEISRMYGISTPELEAEARNNQMMGDSYEPYSSNPNDNILLGSKTHLWRVIEYHYMEKLNTTRLSGQQIDSIRWIPFPITKDKKKLEKFMMDNKIDPLTIQEFPYEDRIHRVITIAPELLPNRVLEEGISKVQVRRLPYLQLSANRAYGKDKGIVDDLLDIQRTINKRESKLTDLIATAQGGGKLVNEALFPDPIKQERFRQRNNDPTYVEFVDGDELASKNAIQYINANEYPAQIINQLMRMWDIVDRVSKVPAALEAMSENANESGVLFERKLQVARTNTITIVNRIRDFRKSMAECYFWQFQIAYNGLERTFSSGKNKVILNKRVFDAETGKTYIENRPDQISRCQVICTESRSAPNRRMRDRAIYSELYNLSVQTNPQYASFFFELLLETMDLSDEKQARLKELSALQQIRDKISIQSEISGRVSEGKQATMAGMQADMAIQQLMQQMQQPAEPPVSRVPEEEIQPPQIDSDDLPSPEEEMEGSLQSDMA